MSNLRLRPLRIEDEAAVRAADLAMVADDFPFALGLADAVDWPSYLAGLAQLQRGVTTSPKWVPSHLLVATVDDVIVGRTSIRHQLNDWLLEFGGHIGYCVLPSFRRHGHATEILRQSLVIARSVGVDRVLITCDDTNIGSATVIERCGGVQDPEWPLTDEALPKRRYWID